MNSRESAAPELLPSPNSQANPKTTPPKWAGTLHPALDWLDRRKAALEAIRPVEGKE